MYDAGRIRRAGARQQVPQPRSSRSRKRRRSNRRRWPFVLLAVTLLMAVGVGGLWIYSQGVLDPGIPGLLNQENYTPKEYRQDVANILIVGIDYEDGRAYGEGMGLTDMILYANFDLANNQLNMLQIPRDSYVGESLPTGGSGKINALYMNGENKKDPIQNLANVISDQYKLPIDYYVSLDMDGFKRIVDTLGGIKVYVPKTMSYGGSSLEQGWRWLGGEEAEFFVRNRKGEGFERSDIDRLDNQRYFYSALFRRLLNLTPADIVKLLPVFDYYCNTNIKLSDVASLGVSALNLEAENVLFCRLPGATGAGLDPTGAERDMFFVDRYGRGTEEDPGTAALLNQYFRTYGDPVPAEALGIPQVTIPAGYTLYPPNVQRMGAIQEEEGGSDIQVEPGYD